MSILNQGHDESLGVKSTGNSTTAALSSGATFTGTGELNNFPQVGVMVKTDNSGTLYFDFSNDGTNWDSTFPVAGFKVASGISEFHTAIKLGRWFRVRFVNDTGVQTYMRLTTYYGANFVPSSAPLNQALSLDSDAIAVRSTIAQDEIRIGRRSGVEGWNKFSYRTGLTSAGGEQTIWATTGNFTPMTTASTFTIAYDGTAGGSTDGSGTTGATQLTFYYIDANGLPAIGTHNLETDGSDVTAFTGLGINRVAVSASGTNNTNASDITITETTGGTTQAIVPAGGSVTQQAIFFTGSNHTAVVKFLRVKASKPSGGGNAKILVKGYVYNRGVDTIYEVFRETVDTQSDTTIDLTDPVGFNLSATDVLYFVADSDANGVDVTCRFSLNQYQNT